MRAPAVSRFSRIAPVYDVISGEWPIYRTPRRDGVGSLRLRPGDAVLDVGCGTGLNARLLRDAVGPGGLVVGVDVDHAMLRQASRRIRRHGWVNVVLVEADATLLTPSRLLERSGGRRFDAVLFTYTLSLMSDWGAAWRAAVDAAAPQARVCVVDLAQSVGRARAWAPVTAAIAAVAGADLSATPWTAVERETLDATAWSSWGGHVQVRAGTLAGK